MSTLIVPLQYKTIQAAINAAFSGDEIIIQPGFYSENLILIGKSHISITANPGVTINDGKKIGGLGFNIQGHHITITGLQCIDFEIGLSVIGNNNTLNNIVCVSNTRNGLIINGDYNKISNSRFSSNAITGIITSGDSNQFINNRIEENQKGLVVINEAATKNIFSGNVFSQNSDVALGIYTKDSEYNIITHNIIEHSKYGILIQHGKTALYDNTLMHTQTGIFLGSTRCFIVKNALWHNALGMVLHTYCSQIIGNAVQSGDETGIFITGSENTLCGNIVIGYCGVGLLLNGNNNIETCNTLQDNTTNLLINCIDYSCDTCASNNVSLLENKLTQPSSDESIFDIFKN